MLVLLTVQHIYILLTVRKIFMTQCMLPNFVYQHRNSYCLSFALFLHFLWTLARSKDDFLQFSLEIIIKQRHKNDIHGTLQGGHYTAWVRIGTAWYKMDDHKVST